jgi:adenosylmethionine-8-amino-7-oxononanoate aminotransferase
MSDLTSIASMDKALIHPLSNWAEQEQKGPWLRESGKGVWLTGQNGEEMFDAFAGMWCVNVGYGQESIVEAAAEQMRKLAYAPAYFGSGSEVAVRFAAELAKRAPGDCNHVYFTPGGGTDAIDTAIRFIRYHNNILGKPQKKHFIALDRAYHGVSTMTAGLTGLGVFHAHFDAPAPTQHHIPTPSPYRHPEGHNPEAVIKTTIDALKAKVRELGPENVAAFICEPIQASGGVHVPPIGFLKAVREACDELDILWICDEVITAFGRTGHLFASGTEGVAPDMITTAKGLTGAYIPMGALIVSDAFYRRIADATPAGTPVGHGHTYSGHPVSAAVGLAALRLYEEGGLLENCNNVAPYFLKRLQEMHELPLVGDVRGRGLLAAVELVANKETKENLDPSLKVADLVLQSAHKNRIIFRCYADGVIALAPALCITKDEIDILIERVKAVIMDVADQISSR